MAESQTELATNLAAIDDVTAAIVWRPGEAPVTVTRSANFAPLTGRMLSAIVATFEQNVHDLGCGTLRQLWWESDDLQCVGFRSGEWQVLVLADVHMGTGTLRENVARAVSDYWDSGETQT